MAESKAIDIKPTFVDPEGGLKEKLNPVILLHAMLCSKEIWVDIPQMVANSTGRRVYTYDARNHGDSEATEKSNFSFNVVDLFAVMDIIKAQMKDTAPEEIKFVIVGHDMGGMTAITAALEKKDMFEMVIIVEMIAKPILPLIISRAKIFTTEWAKCVRKVPANTPPENVGKLSVENLYQVLEKDMQEPNEKASYMKGTFSFKKTGDHYEVKYHTENINKALDELKKHQGYGEKQYNGPTYFFYGTESHYKVQDEGESMNKHFPKAEFVKFDKGSHFFIVDVPAKLAEELSDAIKGEKIKKVK